MLDTQEVANEYISALREIYNLFEEHVTSIEVGVFSMPKYGWGPLSLFCNSNDKDVFSVRITFDLYNVIPDEFYEPNLRLPRELNKSLDFLKNKLKFDIDWEYQTLFSEGFPPASKLGTTVDLYVPISLMRSLFVCYSAVDLMTKLPLKLALKILTDNSLS